MFDNVYKITPTVSSHPTLLVMAENELEARATATGTLNSSFAALITPVRINGNGVAMLDQYYDSNNASCQELESGKDYNLLNTINEHQIKIGVGDQSYIVSSIAATLITNSNEIVN